MKEYKRIQFIAYEISTAPKNAKFKNGVIESGEYVGLEDIDKDIEQRCNLMKDAIVTAENNRIKATDDSETLKLFMSPEFYFRGPKGAYEMDEAYKAIDSLQQLVKDEKWKDWLFVFGSIIGNSTPDQSAWLLKFEESELFREVYNIVLVQQGGFEEDSELKEKSARIVIKEFISKIDFIIKPSEGISISQAKHMKHFPAGSGKEEQLHNYDGLGVFEADNLTFGLEICLDHLQKRLKESPQLPGSNMVEFQLIPSCGMKIKADSVVAQNEGYVFNVDGMTLPSSDLRKVVMNNISLLPVNSDTFDVDLTIISPEVEVDKIFANKKGKVRVYNSIVIPAQQKVAGSYTMLQNTVIYDSITGEENYKFHYLIEYDEFKKYKTTYITVFILTHNYVINKEQLPVDGELFSGQIKLVAEVKKVNLPNGDDRMIMVDFKCDGNHVEGGFISFRSSLE